MLTSCPPVAAGSALAKFFESEAIVVTTDSKPVRVTVPELREFVEEESAVLAELYSRTCPACDAQEPILGGVAREYEGVVAMVDPGEDLSALEEFGVRSTPGFVLFRDGEQVDTLADGIVGADRLLAFARGEAADGDVASAGD